MRSKISTLVHWPLRHNKEPILNSTEEALFYAQLIHKNPIKQAALVTYRIQTYSQLRVEREKENPDLQFMMDMAVRAQLFREAYVEAARIQHEKFKLSGG